MPCLLLLDRTEGLDSCGGMQGALSKSKRITTSNTTSGRARPRNPTTTHLPNLLTDRDERPIRPKTERLVVPGTLLVQQNHVKYLVRFSFICMRVSPQQLEPCPCWFFQTPSTIVTGPPVGVADDTKVSGYCMEMRAQPP